MKNFIIVFAVLLMLGGGTFSIMKTLDVGPFAKAGGEASDKTELNEPHGPSRWGCS